MDTKLKTTTWDASEYLDSPEMIQEYLNAAMEEEDQDVLLMALENIAKAKGMTELSQETGLGRASLYKTFKPGSKPAFSTIKKVVEALGLHLQTTSKPVH